MKNTNNNTSGIYKKKVSGFTLIELMVTISIFTLLITAFYSGTSNAFQHRNNIRDEINTIQSLFSTARNLAITSKGVQEDGSTTTVVPQYGYGVHVQISESAGKNETIFTLFANTYTTATEKYSFERGAGKDIIISEYSAFTKGVARGVETEITLTQNDGNIRLEKIKKNSAQPEFTILFSPLDAYPVLVFNNDPGDISYEKFSINFYKESLIEETLEFHKISRFFERVRLCPSNSASPSDCSTRQP